MTKIKNGHWTRRESNTQPSDLESDALPLRHGSTWCVRKYKTKGIMIISLIVSVLKFSYKTSVPAYFNLIWWSKLHPWAWNPTGFCWIFKFQSKMPFLDFNLPPFEKSPNFCKGSSWCWMFIYCKLVPFFLFILIEVKGLFCFFWDRFLVCTMLISLL